MKNQKKSSGLGISFSKAKIVFNFYPWWRRAAKAKKMTKMIVKDSARYSEQQRYDFAKKVVGKLMKVFNVNIHVFGIENWLDRGVVLVSNHQSNLDPMALLAINDYEKQQPIGFIAKKELWEVKTVKNFMNLLDNLPLDRESPRSALKVMKDAKELISQYKRAICIFPEGTRSHSQELGEFQPAATKLAQMAFAPIIPVSIIDSYKIEDKKRPKKLDIKVVFGKPMMPDKFISMKSEDLAKNVKREIDKGIKKYENIDLKVERKKVKKINKKTNCYFY
jgi:1-acyl-sn-glycerol-3-phosphate acyltransferase